MLKLMLLASTVSKSSMQIENSSGELDIKIIVPSGRARYNLKKML